MRQVRGFIYFENKSLSDVRTTFGNFKFDEAVFSYFSSLNDSGKNINSPGVFLSGQVNSKYTVKNIVRLFRKLMVLDEEEKNAWLSLAGECVLEPLLSGGICGMYAGLKIQAPYIKDNVLLLADEAKQMVAASDICLRSDEPGELPSSLRLEFITDADFLKHRAEIEKTAEDLNLRLTGCDLINLYRKI